MELSSKYLQQAVDQMASLPGIGKRTALRLVLHLLNQEKSEVEAFSKSFAQLKDNVKTCTSCHNISDSETCQVCRNPGRDESKICVVQDVRDVLAIEHTMQYRGLYHVLGGIISPMDGIGPDNLTINSLLLRAQKTAVQEVILALSATMEGDTTNFYLFKKLHACSVDVSIIARGIGVGSDLEFTDEITLGRSILSRHPFESALAK